MTSQLFWTLVLVQMAQGRLTDLLADHEICCVHHAHFPVSVDDGRLAKIDHKPMSEYAAAGLEAARKPPDPTPHKGYERREAGRRKLASRSVIFIEHA
jgi:hypothetical protein